MFDNSHPALIVVCGWPLSGKNTIAKHIAEALRVHWIDIDDIRILNFGPPDPHPNISEETMEQDRREMKGSYELLYAGVNIVLGMKRSLIITATFSRASYWEPLLAYLAQYPETALKVIWCRPLKDGDEEIARRLEGRIFGVNSWSSVNSMEHYAEVKNRFEIPPVTHLELDTSPPHSPNECAKQVIAYILSSE